MAFFRRGTRRYTLRRRRRPLRRRFGRRKRFAKAVRRIASRQVFKKAETKVQYVLSALAVPSAAAVTTAQFDEFPQGAGTDEILGRQFYIQAVNIKMHMTYQDSSGGAAVAPARLRFMIVQIFESTAILPGAVPDDYLVTGPATSMYTSMWSPIKLLALQDRKYKVLYDRQFQVSTDLWNQRKNFTIKLRKFRRLRTKYGAGAGNNQLWAIWWGEPNATTFTNDFLVGWQAAVTCKDP